MFVASVSAQVLPPGGTFVDDNGSIFEGAIEAIAAAGITTGCNPPVNDEFCPERKVTRGEMAAFLVRALDLTATGPGNFFTDDDESIFEGDIDKLAHAGITKGCNPPTNDEFCPDVSVSRGAMAAFLVRGYGYTDDGGGNLFIDDDDSEFETDIDKLGTEGVTKGCNPPINDMFCPTQSVTREQMAAFLQRAEGLTPIIPPPPNDPTLEVFVGGLSSPVHVTGPHGDDRVFVVEKPGRIRIVENGVLHGTPFLDIEDVVSSSGERGLLSMAFHPDYASNGRYFVFYSAFDQPAYCPSIGCHTSKVVEYQVSSDPDVSETDGKLIIEIDQPYSNHNGGQLAFGPDGYLYIGTGDGGGSNDPERNGQNTTNLNGAMLRLDVDGASPYAIPADNPYVGGLGLDEIWAIGLRNPWRFSFDGDYLYIGDVGQSAREEIDVVHAPTSAGANFGWCTYEGTLLTGLGCGGSGFTFPVLEYSHSPECSVTGGHVYRGDEFPQLDGHYFYADFCTSWIKTFRLVDGVATDITDRTAMLGAVPSIVSFGTDGLGNFYVVSIAGAVYRLEAT